MRDRNSLKQFAAAAAVVFVLVSLVFAKSCSADQMLFNNDAPLGVFMADYGQARTAWTGVWNDLNWLGIADPAALPNWAALIVLTSGDRITFQKFLVPIDLIFLGLCTIICLRQFGMRYSVCGIAAIAAVFNMNGFSHAAWGLPSRCTAMGFTFLALAALRSSMNGQVVAKSLLAGFCVGSAILEAYDVGAIYSLYVGVFAVFVVLAFARVDALNVGKAVLRAGMVAGFAAVCAAAALMTLVSTQVQGVSGMQQDEASKQERWDGATMWSLPKAETFRVLSPGLFGYRMDATDGSQYWGSAGQSPGVPTTRHSGSGEYAGALVVVLAAFGIANGFRRRSPIFTDVERRVILFFSAAALVSLLFAWGRHAPFYQLVYSLPFFSTIRNPMKFMHPFHMALIILFGFGLEAIFRGYVKEVEGKAGGLKETMAAWWSKAAGFDRKWVLGSLAFCGSLLMGVFVYTSSRKELTGYLRTGGFSPGDAEQIASYSYGQAMTAWFLVMIAVILVAIAMSGWFSGRRARYLVLAAGLFVAVDLVRSNLPWVQYYNYKERYASNDVLEFLRRNPHEQRTTARVTPFGSQHLSVDNQTLGSVANQWLQNQFQYYNIHALEPVQMPRPPEIDQRYFRALLPTPGNSPTVITRLWELTSTRWLIGDTQFIGQVFQQLEPGQQRHQTALKFDMAPKPGAKAERLTLDDLTWVQNPNGRFAVVEFTGALPRANLYPAWQKVADDEAALRELTSPLFNPRTNVLVHGEVPFGPGDPSNFQGQVRVTSYHPKRIELAVSNNAPAVLLYNDKLAPGWSVTLDGKPHEFVRANFIMRGVPVPAGQHTVVMTYATSTRGLVISLAGLAVTLGALGLVSFAPLRQRVANDPGKTGVK